MMNAPAALIEAMVVEWRIRDVVGRYARGIDRRDGSIIRGCFHANARMRYGDFDGTIEDFVPWVLAFVSTYRATVHFMGSTVIDGSADTGKHVLSETYASVWHEVASGSRGRSWVGLIRYLDRFEYRGEAAESEGSWRIAERTVVGDLLRTDPAENHRTFAAALLSGRPDTNDPLYAMLTALSG